MAKTSMRRVNQGKPVQRDKSSSLAVEKALWILTMMWTKYIKSVRDLKVTAADLMLSSMTTHLLVSSMV